ncbi:MAG: asparaginase [Gammaproteobacteria bacterium]|nr:asparaginase [Gammaproteobacteria bacterium]
MSSLPKVTLFALGGTISAHHDDRLELCQYKSGHYSGADFLSALPELSALADIDIVQLNNISSTAIDESHWFDLKQRIEQSLLGSDAVVITHGTNTLEETAFFLHLTLNTDKPVVMTGAQKPFSALGSDAYFNLLNSVRVALCPQAIGQGVLVVANDKIYSARDVSKTHTYYLETFQAPNNGPLGRIEANQQVNFMHRSIATHKTEHCFHHLNQPERIPYIAIIYSYAGADQRMIEALLLHTQLDGLVIAGTGAGRCSPLEASALLKVRERGIPVVMSSRVGAGAVLPLNGYQHLDLITLDDLPPQKARIWLLLHVLSTN